MKLKPNLMIFCMLVYVFLMVPSFSGATELIEPTRTMQDKPKPLGRLSVFSEPPEIEVFLDGLKIGKTPLISNPVTPGAHMLRIKDTEKKIMILPGKTLQLSLYKDSLIEIPEKKVEVAPKTEIEEKALTEEKQTEDTDKKKKEDNPFYWPLNPSGPIR